MCVRHNMNGRRFSVKAQYFLVFMNILSFVLMGLDKRRAVRHRWRIPERLLFLVAIFGGSLGALLGMWIFWHKIRNKVFVIGLPVILILHLVLLFAVVPALRAGNIVG